MKGGGNITDISQYNGIKLITSYWSSFNETNECSYSFVGDVHGDLHQFLAPLIINNIIKLKNSITTIDESIYYFVPEYDINTSSSSKVVYLGDVADEWIFSRTISHMLYTLLKNGKIIYIYGNHDLSIIGRYHLFKQRKINFASDMPPLWVTMKKELNPIREIKFHKNTILFNNDESLGLDFLYKYISPLFENLYKIFIEQFGHISIPVEINKNNFIISHSTWSKTSIKQLLQNTTTTSRDCDNNESQLLPLNPNHTSSEQSIRYLNSLVSSNFSSIDYIKLSNSVNDVFNSSSRLFISKNNITYTRNTDSIFVNQITGHSIGGEFRDINVNSSPSTYEKERIEKLKPSIINNCKIYYFDFGSSAGYDHDEISRPDYVYVNSNGMFVSNLPGFSFITSSDKDSLLIMKDKTPRSKNKIVIN